ncbi:molybdate transport system ATP-binding protein [Litorivivens lipolytica]|uniref:Molybdate transport system ATP-binding protein n=1 Tax=Litorivivens lipolytica TaxID=1524264 RepID=A0A7W4W5P6_9GAMM|nr:molybdate ABC transporter ATP-binding protein ModF [Litorivivens lipolytica]MBB3047946.1 molybdate transport system ATP-binding protein [Litorivivens lipolytica]
MQLHNISLTLGGKTVLSEINWQIPPGECWGILGTNASGKSSLAQVLSGELSAEGEITGLPERVLWVSLESQQALYEDELYRDESDLTNEIDEGRTVRQLLEEIAPWSPTHKQLCETLNLSALLDRGYRRLSSGEGRRALLACALLQKPDLLILDEPFEGLDQQSYAQLKQSLNALVLQGQWLMLVVNQSAQLIDECRHVALLDAGKMLYQGPRPEELESVWQQLDRHRKSLPQLPPRNPEFQLPSWPDEKPLLVFTNAFVQYGDTFQFRDFNWQLQPGQHTRIHGPNGSGKSTLLGLITGDHPQCYRNDLEILGFRRGSGESIWEIKKHIGYVSGSLHRDYRASASALTVVISGLTDSIGVYSAVGEKERELGLHWLDILGLREQANAPFRSLSMGQQQLLLIARALIKQPPLIILDEPTEGLDDFNRFYVLKIVEKLIAASGSTLLLVSHREDETLACIKHTLEFVPVELDEVRYNITHTIRD